MPGHILELRGCTPEPLGNYLKGLGVFRLIAEQADPQARAWWKNGVLWLQAKWSREEVMEFFLHGIGKDKTPIYSPTPIFAPWGGRSAFLKDGGNPKAIARLKRLQAGESTSPRFRPAQRRSVQRRNYWDDSGSRPRRAVKRQSKGYSVRAETNRRTLGSIGLQRASRLRSTRSMAFSSAPEATREAPTSRTTIGDLWRTRLGCQAQNRCQIPRNCWRQRYLHPRRGQPKRVLPLAKHGRPITDSTRRRSRRGSTSPPRRVRRTTVRNTMVRPRQTLGMSC